MTALTPDQEAYIAARVAAGDFAEADDAVALAFQLLKERERDAARLHHLRADLDFGLAQLDRGESEPFDALASLERIKESKVATRA